MNIFSGSRRIAIVLALIWVVGFLIAGVFHTTTIQARYDIVLGQEYAKFFGFDKYGCPKSTEKKSFEFETDGGHQVRVNLCVAESTRGLPEGFAIASYDPVSLLSDPKYVNADESTKLDLFEEYVAGDPSYTNANEATKQAIRKRFGVPERNGSFDPDKYLASKVNPFEKYQSDEYFAATFKIQKEDQDRLNEKWWQSWRGTYGLGVLVTVGGLLVLWLFTFAVGWVARGFMGIPRGMDSKSK